MRILAAVYNPIAYDGRVQRACEALAKDADLELMCPDGPAVPADLPFRVRTVSLPKRASAVRRHAVFSLALIRRAYILKPDLVHAHDYFMAGPGAFAAKAAGGRLVYDAHELIVPQENERLSLHRRFWYQCERFAIRRADLIIAANEARARLMRDHYGLEATPVVVRNIPPRPTSGARPSVDQPRRSQDERVCIYQGEVALRRGLGRILECVRYLPENVRLLIVGGGPDEQTLKNEIMRLNLQTRVTLVGRVPREQLHALLEACDVGLLTYPFTGLNNIYCAPNKIFEYAHAGLPIVSTNQPPIEEMIAKYQIGVSYGQTDEPAEIAARIMSIVNDPAPYKSRLERFLAENEWQDEAQRLREAVRSIQGEWKAT